MYGIADPEELRKPRGSIVAKSCTKIEQSFETSVVEYGGGPTIQQQDKGSA
jgi:hypothetical protein